jgi:hypothetical protein
MREDSQGGGGSESESGEVVALKVIITHAAAAVRQHFVFSIRFVLFDMIVA